MKSLLGIIVAACSALPLYADTFGSGTNQFTIEFVDVGNAGNGDDLFPRNGGVAYNYRISAYEVSQDMVDKATAMGLTNVVTGPWTGDQPAAKLYWNAAAEFVNWLNESQGFHSAYDTYYRSNTIGWWMRLWDETEQATTGVDAGTNPYRHKHAFYFLPSDDEWMKAAFHKNDGVTSHYWDYLTGSDNTPDGIDSAGDSDFEAVFNDGYVQAEPNSIYDTGSSPSPYGTFGQGGNIWEWTESAEDGENSSTQESRRLRGGDWKNGVVYLGRRNWAFGSPTSTAGDWKGIRVASLALPLLQISPASSNTVSISWEPALPVFVLQETVTLSPVTWTNSPSNTNNPTVIPVGDGTKYFRVVKP